MKQIIIYDNQNSVFGLDLYNNTGTNLAEEINSRIVKKVKTSIVSINPEIALLSQKDQRLHAALQTADFRIADGVGVWLASGGLLGRTHLIRGRELLLKLLDLANKKKYRVYFLGSSAEVIEKSLAKAKIDYPHAIVEGQSGPQLDTQGQPESSQDKKLESQVCKEINDFKPDILFVAFGAPKQEKWVEKHLHELNVSVAMVVGGALDYFSGAAKLPPQWIAAIGFEWLFRLIQEPSRLRRICHAVVLFPLAVIKSKITA